MESGQEVKAKDYFLKAIQLKRELNDATLLPAIHRSYSLLNDEERVYFFELAKESERDDFTKKEKCWLANIILMNSCADIPKLAIERIKKATDEIILLANESKIRDIDDLPVESFYLTAKKLIAQREFKLALDLSKQALLWIGESITLRKSELEAFVNTDNDNWERDPVQ